MKKKGFTLVEIMIVVAIIALLAAVAIPNLLRARLNANEGAAIGNMHTLVQALGSFQANQNPPTYPSSLADLASANPPYIDSVLASGIKQGYQFIYTPGTPDARGAINDYTLRAVPIVEGRTGVRHFFADESGVIRVGDDASGTPIE